jgi:signal transduction histidine kinase
VKQRTLIAAWLGCLAVASVAFGAGSAATKRILVLHDTGAPGAFRSRFNVAFAEAIRSGDSMSLDLYEELIDAQRFPGEEQSRLVREYVNRKYAGRTVDVLVTGGMASLAFARENRPLFGNPPIVAMALPAAQPAAGRDDVTGLEGGLFIGGTIDLALALRPDTRLVVAVDGARQNGKEIQAEFERQIRARADRLELLYLRDLSLSDLLARVAAVPEHAIVFFVRQTMRDRTQDMDSLEALAEVVAASPAPVFSDVEEFLGHGIVGGHIWRFEQDARRLGEMARRIASGASVRDLPRGWATYTTMVDWRQLQRYQIAEARLPPGTVVAFRPPSFFEPYRRYVIGGLIVFAAQLALFLGLLAERAWRRRAETESKEHETDRRKAEEALGQAEARNSAMLRAIPDLMFVLRRDGTFIDYFARDPQLLAAPPATFLGRTVRDVLPPAIADVLMNALERAFDTDETIVVEYELAVDETRQFEARLVHADADRVLTIVRDMTEAKRAQARNRDLAGRLIVSQEVERQRIARELHDDVSQKIALLNVEIDQMAAQIDVDGLRVRLKRLSSRAGEIAGDVHALSHELHPARLRTLGLVASMQSLCREISKQGVVEVVFAHGIVPASIEPDVSLCLYRIAQEALHNVARHSHARDAEVQLAVEGANLTLKIADSGVGFDEHAQHDGLGLVSMRERVALVRGQVAIHTSPGGGTRIGVRVPLIGSGADSVSPAAYSA